MQPSPQELYERRVRWAEALEEPGRQQSTGTLCRIREALSSPVGDCCLGVWCRVAEADGRLESAIAPEGDRLIFRSSDPTDVDFDDVGYPDGSTDYLPRSEARYLGLRSRNGELRGATRLAGVGRYDSLASANDAGEPFAKIAAFVRDQAGRALRGESQELFNL